MGFFLEFFHCLPLEILTTVSFLILRKRKESEGLVANYLHIGKKYQEISARSFGLLTTFSSFLAPIPNIRRRVSVPSIIPLLNLLAYGSTSNQWIFIGTRFRQEYSNRLTLIYCGYSVPCSAVCARTYHTTIYSLQRGTTNFGLPKTVNT